MAYFDDIELIDLIRHGFALDDDTGLCTKVLDRPSRRGKPGGLPLNFGLKYSDSEDEQHSPDFWFDADQPPCPTMNEIFQNTILNKIGDSDKDRPIDVVKQPVVEQSLNVHPVEIEKPETSLTSRLLEEMPEIQHSQFEEYAKFEATSTSTSKTVAIIFQFAARMPGEDRPCVLDVNCINAAKISDLIGLACFIYTRNRRLPQMTNPNDYELHLADDDFEVDMELPRIDPNNYVGELHFPILALVPKAENGLNSKELFHVSVFLHDGQVFKFELDNLDYPLQWLKDKAIERKRQELTKKTTNPYMSKIDEYVLEKAEKGKNSNLKMDKPISSAGTLEFLLLRKNSSRGDFHRRYGSNDLEIESLLTPPPVTPCGRRSPRFDFPTPSTSRVPTPSTSAGSPGSVQHRESHSSIQEEYVVDRVHRLKPKMPAKLVLHENFLELVPTNFDRPKIFSKPLSQKYLSIEYDWVGAVEVQKSTTHGRRMLKIIWLKNTSEAEKLNRINTFSNISSARKISRQSSTISYNELNWQHFCQAYERAQWKTLQLETNEEDAWKIGVRLNDIVEGRDSIVRNVYLHSSFGTLSPIASAEVAFKPKLSTTTGPSGAGPSTPTTPSRRKPSFIPPMLARMISRHD